MDNYYCLKWTFTPSDYFGQELSPSLEGVTISIGHGVAEARVDKAIYEQDFSLRKKLHEYLLQAFRGAQLSVLEPFELSWPAETEIRADGKRIVYFGPSTISASSRASANNTVIHKADGTVIDTKAERLAQKRQFGELVQKHSSDRYLVGMLRSISSALTNKDNCLVYLYEILDSLTLKFSTKKQALAALSLTKDSWSTLGRLANDEPLQEGRHRGRAVVDLRPATQMELDECMSIAREFVVAYIQYLEEMTALNPTK